jgi:hypothetical protein
MVPVGRCGRVVMVVMFCKAVPPGGGGSIFGRVVGTGNPNEAGRGGVDDKC